MSGVTPACPECGSTDVFGASDPRLDAIGCLECANCGFGGLDDDFDCVSDVDFDDPSRITDIDDF